LIKANFSGLSAYPKLLSYLTGGLTVPSEISRYQEDTSEPSGLSLFMVDIARPISIINLVRAPISRSCMGQRKVGNLVCNRHSCSGISLDAVLIHALPDGNFALIKVCFCLAVREIVVKHPNQFELGENLVQFVKHVDHVWGPENVNSQTLT